MSPHSEKKQIGRSILLFTCRDDPHGQDEQRQRQAVAKAQDLKESYITLEILHMGATFNLDKFYKAWLCYSPLVCSHAGPAVSYLPSQNELSEIAADLIARL